MNSLKQKNGRNAKYFEILEDGILVKDDFAKEVQEYKVHFTEIQDDETVFRKSKDFVLLGIAISVVFNGIFLNIIINESFNLSRSVGIFVFALIMIPALVVVDYVIMNSEKKTQRVWLQRNRLCFFTQKKM